MKKIIYLLSFIVVLSLPLALCGTTITSLPIVISTPGEYTLDCDLTNSDPNLTSIVIAADSVQINGNGYSIIGSTDAAAINYGIRVIDHTDVQIYNLTITGHRTGIIIGDTVNAKASNPSNYGLTAFRASTRLKVTDVNLTRQTFQGIHIRGDDVFVDKCAIQHIGGATTPEHATITGIDLNADNCTISNNRIYGLYPSGSGQAIGISIAQGDATKITSNVISFPRRSTYGRNYGIWSRSSNFEDTLVSENFISGADYAFGPFGVITDNVAMNTSCKLYVDRIFNLDETQVTGWLTTDNNRDLSNPKKRQCPDDVNYAIDIAQETPNGLSAYSVASAYAEQDPTVNEPWSLAWILRADELGHSIATSIVNSSSTAGRSQATYDDAVALLPAVRALTGS